MDTAYRPVYGFLLSLLTAFLWGVLPVALTLCLTVMDSPTITFFRFITAGVVVLALLQLNNNIPTLNMLSKKACWVAIGATIMLVTNYVTNVMGLRFLSASSALVFCCLNTLVAYGAFTEAMRVWFNVGCFRAEEAKGCFIKPPCW